MLGNPSKESNPKHSTVRRKVAFGRPFRFQGESAARRAFRSAPKWHEERVSYRHRFSLIYKGIPSLVAWVAIELSLCASLLKRTYYNSLLTGVLSVLFHYIHLPKLSYIELLLPLLPLARKALIYKAQTVAIAKAPYRHSRGHHPCLYDD
jgi:hypothetical protein